MAVTDAPKSLAERRLREVARLVKGMLTGKCHWDITSERCCGGAEIMEQPSIFSATLGLSHPWKVTAVTYASEENRLDITVDFDLGSDLRCSCCGRDLTPGQIEQEVWHHDDFHRYSTYLHAKVPSLQCDCGRIFPVERPWSRPGSRFALVR